MPSERAGLSAVDFPDLSELHTPLSSRRVRERIEPEVLAPAAQDTDTAGMVTPNTVHKERQPSSAPTRPAPATQPSTTKDTAAAPAQSSNAAAYPSLSAAPREHLIPYSVRLPISQIDALDKICRARHIDKSNLVRDFIAVGLKSLVDEIAALS